MIRWIAASLTIVALSIGAACGGDSDAERTPAATPTPEGPSAEEAIAEWVAANRNINFVQNCDDARRATDIGKLCATLVGRRGTRVAYNLGPTFADPTALAILEERPDGWHILSVRNRDPSAGDIPGIPWPLQVGDAVLIIGVGDGDCLSIRDQPGQSSERLNCMPDGTRAIVQEGPVEADTFVWWRIAGEGFNGWAAENWLRIEDEIRSLFEPPTPEPSEDEPPEDEE